MSSMAESGTIADIQVSVRQITQRLKLDDYKEFMIVFNTSGEK